MLCLRALLLPSLFSYDSSKSNPQLTISPNRTNNKSAFLLLRSASQHITDNGSIITIVTSLLAAYTGLYTSYAGTKAGVEHFTRGLSKELMGRGVSVNAVAPGPMDTRTLPSTLPISFQIQLEFFRGQ